MLTLAILIASGLAQTSDLPVAPKQTIAAPASSEALPSQVPLALTPPATAPLGPVEPTQNVPAQTPPSEVTPSAIAPQASAEASLQAVTPNPSSASPSRDPNEIVVKARERTRGDPFARLNARSFAITQEVDKAVIGPAAMAYQERVPSPLRSGLRNLIGNIREPVNFANYFLPLKVGKAAETAGRFVINSTVGVAGVFDIAKRRPFRLPRRVNSLANTMGFYGIKPGPFFYLPLIGPTTLRDLTGTIVDRLVLPLSFGTPFNNVFFTVPVGVVGQLDTRAEFDEQLHALHDHTPDPYVATRDYYLTRRQAEIDLLRLRHRRKVPPAPADSIPATLPVK